LMIMEYLTISYLYPKQRLPFIGIVSKEKGTGKTTFLNFVKMIFGDNAIFISEHDISSNFNEHYVGCSFILSDEHTEGKSRIRIAERLKMMITAKNIRTEQKYGQPYNVTPFFKPIFCSNEEEMMTYIGEENTRYWIIKANQLKETIIDIESKLKNEIPAFLYHLKNYVKLRKSQGRLYFDPKQFQTEASRLIQKNSISGLHAQITDYLKDLFDKVEPSYDELYFCINDLIHVLELKQKDRVYLKSVLQKEMYKYPNRLRKYVPGYFFVNSGNKKMKSTVGRPYVFYRSDHEI